MTHEGLRVCGAFGERLYFTTEDASSILAEYDRLRAENEKLRDAIERANRLLGCCYFDQPEDIADLVIVEDACKLPGRE